MRITYIFLVFGKTEHYKKIQKMDASANVDKEKEKRIVQRRERIAKREAILQHGKCK